MREIVGPEGVEPWKLRVLVCPLSGSAREEANGMKYGYNHVLSPLDIPMSST